MSAALTLAPPVSRRLKSLAAILILLALWEVAARLFVPGVNPIIPPPSVLVTYVARHAGLLLISVQPTIVAAISGFCIGASISIVLAVIFVRFPTVEAALANSVVLLHALPMLAIIPLLVIWFGIGYTPKIIIAALATFFPVLNGALRGLRSSERSTLELMHILDAHWLQTLTKVKIPFALPYIFAGLKIAAPQAVLGATVAEWIGSRSGLGSQILIALLNYDVPLLWACMVACALLAATGFCLILLIEYLVIGRRSEPLREED
ncbi:NitT/TauT family transport system permease protein [Devosia enhydra]|uniref:NitT/TauT family transport system permease protein n=1 Tax=Devosia enhydra TaxID=665118 RepID=A0A1K2HVZ8_9HYPH|nr:ABC transporter permease [Devosia enhydra]SFZ83060.1 NitT/TauT family transport system permease protein [Devosia enhydra]